MLRYLFISVSVIGTIVIVAGLLTVMFGWILLDIGSLPEVDL